MLTTEPLLPLSACIHPNDFFRNAAMAVAFFVCLRPPRIGIPGLAPPLSLAGGRPLPWAFPALGEPCFLDLGFLPICWNGRIEVLLKAIDDSDKNNPL